MRLQVVWRAKCRLRILGGRVARRLSELLEQIADKHGWQIVAKDGMADHAHLFVGVGPADAPAPVVRAFKGAAHGCCGQSFRSSATTRRCCGRRRTSTVRRYIEHQWDAVLAS
jgi:putative transposase